MILLIVCLPMFLAGCWMLIVMERESRQCTVTSALNIIPLPSANTTPIVQPRRRSRGRPHLYVLPPLDQPKSKLS